MYKTLQLQRHNVKLFNDHSKKYLGEFGFDEVHENNTAWVTIREPLPAEKPHVENDILSPLPKLQIRFWDLTTPVFDYPPEGGEQQWLHPPSEMDANAIVRFLMDHEGKDIITNCFAGISRSGAVCKFLQDQMGYNWIHDHKILARPNLWLYSLMIQEHNKIKAEETRYAE